MNILHTNISNNVIISWVRYINDSYSLSSITHYFPIMFNEIYNIQVSIKSNVDAAVNNTYSGKYTYTMSSITFVYNTGKFILIIGS